MAKLDDQIQKLQENLKKLKARQQALENQEKARANKRERKADTRRKILIGAVVKAKVEQKVMAEELLRQWLDEALTRADDRALFALPPRA
jgi:hypothetical protein